MKIWPFGKQKTELVTHNPESPVAEVKEYYDANRHERQGMAWFLAFATLVVTVLLATAIFFGGRWVYHQIKGQDQPATPVAVEKPASTSKTTEPATPPQKESDTSKPTNPPATTTTPPASSNTAPSTTAPAPSAPAATPTTGPDLPHTGPTGDD